MKNWKQYSILVLVFTLLAYPMFYYVLKYGTPEFGGKDVFSYMKLYTNWDYASVDSPFNQRIVSSYIIYLIHQSGIHYNTEMSVTRLGIDPQVYFSALLFNFLCVVATCVVIFKTIQKQLQASGLIAFIGASLFLFGFGTQAFLISALSDALSVLFVALLLHFFLEKSWWQLPILALSIFQREYIFFVFGLVAAFYWWQDKTNRKYYLQVLAANIVCFLIYFVCRKTIFFTPRYEHQIAFDHFISNIALSIQDVGAYIRQSFLTQNLVFLYLAVYAYKRFTKQKVATRYLVLIGLLLLEIVFLSLLIRLGNNTGRYFYMTAPIVIYFLIAEALPLLRAQESTNTKEL